MLEDEFKQLQFPRGLLNFGRSPKEVFITVPKAVFEQPPEEKIKFLRSWRKIWRTLKKEATKNGII